MSPSRHRVRRSSPTKAMLSGSRVAVRPLTGDDLRMMASWFDRGMDLRRRLRGARSGDSDQGLLGIAFRGEDGAIGVIDYCVGVPEDGWLVFRFVTVEQWLRGLELDSEAVRLVEDDALKRGLARRFWAGVHHNHGLGFYFWLRLGHRPARPDEGPWWGHRPNDIIPLMRMPENAGAGTENQGPA